MRTKLFKIKIPCFFSLNINKVLKMTAVFPNRLFVLPLDVETARLILPIDSQGFGDNYIQTLRELLFSRLHINCSMENSYAGKRKIKIQLYCSLRSKTSCRVLYKLTGDRMNMNGPYPSLELWCSAAAVCTCST